MSLPNSFAPTTPAEIERALSFIPADLLRDDWIAIGDALKTEGISQDVFDSWSSTADSYRPKECRQQWNSFRGKHTAGTIFFHAKQYGYKHENSNEKPDYQAIEQRKAEQAKKATEQAKTAAEQAKTAAKKCADIFATATDAPANHPYLLRKQIPETGLKIDKYNNLLIPVFNSDNQIISLQTISHEGKKLFTKESATKGGFFLIGEVYPDSNIRIAEGYSKAVRSYLSNGEPVFIAFSKQNLATVALMLRNQYPSRDIIINADNDHLNAKNAGLDSANHAAKLINGFVCVPHCKGSDFDDVFLEFGHEETVRQLSELVNPNATEPEPAPMLNDYPPDYLSHDADYSSYQDSATPPQQTQQKAIFKLISHSDLMAKEFKTNWLIRDFIEFGNLGLIFGNSASGKSLLVQDMSFCIAAGLDFKGQDTKKGKVVYIAGEGFAGLQKRFKALESHYNTTNFIQNALPRLWMCKVLLM